MKLIQEFKDFAIKGNMIDMAIGIIIGAAFKDVVNIIVEKVFLPPLSLLTDGINFKNKKIVLYPERLDNAGKKIEEIAISYGEVINVLIDFFIIAIVVFFVIKFMNSLKTKAEDPKNTTEKTPKDIQLLDELKDLLKEQNELLRNLKE